MTLVPRSKLLAVSSGSRRKRDGSSQTVLTSQAACDINDEAVTPGDPPKSSCDPRQDLLPLTSSGPLYLNKAELMRYGQVRPSRASLNMEAPCLAMSPTQQRQEVSLASFRGQGARGSRSLTRVEDGRMTRAEDRRLRHSGVMFASMESLDKVDTGRKRKIRFNPYHEFSD